jgi:U3 small nucleolar RNA-associated protein 22
MHKSHKIIIPFPETTIQKNAAFKLAYSHPSDIDVVGSYALKTMVKGEYTPSVDMVVTLPPSVLQDKDYLNYRYFYKRAYYLACLAAGLQSGTGNDFEFCFEYLGGNSLQPILVVKPGNSLLFELDTFLKADSSEQPVILALQVPSAS